MLRPTLGSLGADLVKPLLLNYSVLYINNYEDRVSAVETRLARAKYLLTRLFCKVKFCKTLFHGRTTRAYIALPIPFSRVSTASIREWGAPSYQIHRSDYSFFFLISQSEMIL